MVDEHMKATGTFAITADEFELMKKELRLYESSQPNYNWNAVSSSSTDMFSWHISLKTYNQLRYAMHLSRIRPVFPRKIRKCHMRKAIKRYSREKKRAQRRYGV